MKPPDSLLARVERLLGSRPVAWHRREGGWTTNERWSLDLADGRGAFAKMAPNSFMADFLKTEHQNLSRFDADFRCEILAWDDDDEQPLLLLEDLRDGRWPPPWEPGDIERVRATLERIWALPIDGLAPDAGLAEWRKIKQEPHGFLSLGIASRGWLDACIDALIDAERSLDYEGNDFLHLDVRSDNICFIDDRVVLVDWNWCVRGRRDMDLAFWLPSLRLEGGPLPEDVAPGLGTYAAALSGFFAQRAPTPPPPTAPYVRKFQQRQLRISLPWACRELGLPRPELQDVTNEIEAADAAVLRGEITDEEWHARVEEPLTDAYLSYSEPWRQSGKGGDDADWRWSRELVLDVCGDGDAVLDVGCANGYLMESLHRWGAERGMRIEPYGLDISWRLAALARSRLPQWADRIEVGNVMSWTPSRRFDVVHTALDYTPPGRGRAHIERVLSEFLVPGGRLVLRAERVRAGTPRLEAQLEEIGLRPDGLIERVHPTSGDVRHTVWLRAR